MIIDVSLHELAAVAKLSLARAASSLQLIHLPLVESELACLLLCQVCEIESDADEVTLGGVIAFILIVIDDHVIAVILSCRHVLEVIEIEGIRQDVI